MTVCDKCGQALLRTATLRHENEALGSQLLDVQQECIRLLAENERKTKALEEAISLIAEEYDLGEEMHDYEDRRCIGCSAIMWTNLVNPECIGCKVRRLKQALAGGKEGGDE